MAAALTLMPVFLDVDRDRFMLSLWKMGLNRKYRLKERYPIAVGAIGHATPTGPYFIVARSRTPDWLGSDGRVYHYEEPWTGTPGNLGNPFDGGFISLGGNPKKAAFGVGIHGVKFPPRLGERASHGCIRMETQEFLDLWGRVPNGALVFIH